MKGTKNQGIGDPEFPVQHHPSKKHREDASSDDEQQDSRRGRSKLERWTSHKERDFSIKSKLSSSTLKLKDFDKNNNNGPVEASKLPDEPLKPIDTVDGQRSLAEERDATDLDVKDADTKPMEGRHLDTVEKLKKRSERFKLPMPSDKDAVAIKKMETEALPSVKSGTPTESEIKPERPARKRRWISN